MSNHTIFLHSNMTLLFVPINNEEQKRGKTDNIPRLRQITQHVYRCKNSSYILTFKYTFVSC